MIWIAAALAAEPDLEALVSVGLDIPASLTFVCEGGEGRVVDGGHEWHWAIYASTLDHADLVAFWGGLGPPTRMGQRSYWNLSRGPVVFDDTFAFRTRSLAIVPAATSLGSARCADGSGLPAEAVSAVILTGRRALAPHRGGYPPEEEDLPRVHYVEPSIAADPVDCEAGALWQTLDGWATAWMQLPGRFVAFEPELLVVVEPGVVRRVPRPAGFLGWKAMPDGRLFGYLPPFLEPEPQFVALDLENGEIEPLPAIDWELRGDPFADLVVPGLDGGGILVDDGVNPRRVWEDGRWRPARDADRPVVARDRHEFVVVLDTGGAVGLDGDVLTWFDAASAPIGQRRVCRAGPIQAMPDGQVLMLAGQRLVTFEAPR